MPTLASGAFPWDPLTIGFGTGVLVIGLALVWRLSGQAELLQQASAIGFPARRLVGLAPAC